MSSQLKFPLSICALFLLFSLSLIGQNSLPSDGGVYQNFTPEQKVAIKSLLNKTQENLISSLGSANNDEYISRVLMENSYKFAKGYSKIVKDKSVPFKLITSSTSFLGCWMNNQFEGTDQCWDNNIRKANGTEYASIQ